MGRVITIEVDSCTCSADALGELMRKMTFVRPYGCYSCFDVTQDFAPIDVDEDVFRLLIGHASSNDEWDVDVFKSAKAFKSTKTGDIVAWYWDGDGTLAFNISGRRIRNTDCKHSYGWEDCEETY